MGSCVGQLKTSEDLFGKRKLKLVHLTICLLGITMHVAHSCLLGLVLLTSLTHEVPTEESSGSPSKHLVNETRHHGSAHHLETDSRVLRVSSGRTQDEAVLHNSGNHESAHQPKNISEVAIVSFKWDHVQEPYVIVLWIFVAGMSKLGGYRLDNMRKV